MVAKEEVYLFPVKSIYNDSMYAFLVYMRLVPNVPMLSFISVVLVCGTEQCPLRTVPISEDLW